jgi:hypothetical protein
MGQSSRLAPSIGPCSERTRSSHSLKRGQHPAQCTLVPPTVLHVHAGRLGKSSATRHDPEVVRSSSHASWLKLGHSSSMNWPGWWWCPASRTTVLTPARQRSVASVPPPAPEPTTTTTPSWSYSKRGIAQPSCGRSGSQSRSSNPRRKYPPFANDGPS